MKHEEQKIAYVLDFDGTVTALDISTELATKFGGRVFQKTEEAYRGKQIGMREWLAMACSSLPPDLDYLTALSLDMAVIRPGFLEFLQFARSGGHGVYIASDGLGFYIEPVLEKSGCLKYISNIYRNETVTSPEGLQIVINTPHPVCRYCGNCKALQVAKLKKKGCRVIYVGDGSNDRFGASRADMVFARDRLAAYFKKNGFSFNPWVDFYDILRLLASGLRTNISAPLCNPEGEGLDQRLEA